MRRARDRILVDTHPRGEEARDEVVAARAPGGHDHPEERRVPARVPQAREVWRKLTDLGFVRKMQEQAAVLASVARRLDLARAESGRHGGRNGGGSKVPGREVEGDALAVPPRGQHSTRRFEAQFERGVLELT